MPKVTYKSDGKTVTKRLPYTKKGKKEAARLAKSKGVKAKSRY
jgi:hypothetical protein